MAAPPISRLGFTTSAQTLTAGVTSGAITVELRASNGQPGTLPSAVTVNLTGTSSGGVFRNTADSANITSISIAAGSSTGSFRYRDTVAATPTITAAATGLTSASQTETVNAAALDHIVIAPKTSTIAPGGSQTYTVSGFDVFNNPRTLTGTTFAITPNGSCNNANASCTATTAGTHTVTATNSGLTDTATLTVATVASKLGFTTSAQTLTAGVTSGTITVQLQSSSGSPVNATSAVTLNLTKSSAGGVFRNATDTPTITSVTIASPVSVWVIPTDEERMIAIHTLAILKELPESLL